MVLFDVITQKQNKKILGDTATLPGDTVFGNCPNKNSDRSIPKMALCCTHARTGNVRERAQIKI